MTQHAEYLHPDITHEERAHAERHRRALTRVINAYWGLPVMDRDGNMPSRHGVPLAAQTTPHIAIIKVRRGIGRTLFVVRK